MDFYRGDFVAKLSPEDFEGNECAGIVEKLIESSLETNDIGTNILLYGPPGTGKTEMAHALAKKNNWNMLSIVKE